MLAVLYSDVRWEHLHSHQHAKQRMIRLVFFILHPSFHVDTKACVLVFFMKFIMNDEEKTNIKTQESCCLAQAHSQVCIICVELIIQSSCFPSHTACISSTLFHLHFLTAVTPQCDLPSFLPMKSNKISDQAYSTATCFHRKAV